MTRTLHKLADSYARSEKLKPGRHSDGGGLYLNVGPTRSKSWLFMWVRDGKRREMGLGAYPAVPLAKARLKASECRALVEDGGDPIAARSVEQPKTFGECADAFIAWMEDGWRNDKHVAQWHMTLGDTYCKTIRTKSVADISTADVLAILTPIWQSKAETASRLRGRIERVLDYAKVKGWRHGRILLCGAAIYAEHCRPARSCSAGITQRCPIRIFLIS